MVRHYTLFFLACFVIISIFVISCTQDNKETHLEQNQHLELKVMFNVS